jgi:glyoxylase-like metal-dependent hydrolase (beta-lactamase superfamily II)
LAVLNPILLEAHNPSPMTGRGNNTYLIAGAGTAGLIDAGPGDDRHLAAVARVLTDHRAVLRDVLVTHAHADHAAGAAALAAAHRHARFVKYPWPGEDARYDVEWQPVRDEEELMVADTVPLRVIHTGGHSPDHVVFWHEATRSAFTGDLVVQGSSVMIHSSRGGDLRQYLAALERLLALGPRTLYPAHGPVITAPEPVLSGYLAHRRHRERQVVAALEAGHSTVQAIADFIYDGLEPTLMAAARENVRAHLEKLRSEGAARCEQDRWSL